MKELPYHKAANAFELIDGPDFDDLVEDIKIHGQRHPIIVTDGQILDGRNRYRACRKLGIAPRLEEWDKVGSPMDFSLSVNMRRRHLDVTARAIAADAAVEVYAQEAAVRQRRGKGSTDLAAKMQQGRSAEHAARECKVSARSVYDVRSVRMNSPAIYAEMRAGKINISQAKGRLAKEIREREVKRQSRKAKPVAGSRIIVGDAVAEMNRLPERSVKVVFADPPYNNCWKYDADPTGDDLPIGEYLDWSQLWMASAARLLSEDGSLFVLIDDANSDHFGVILRRLGLNRRNTIIWWDHFPQNTAGNFSLAAKFIHYYTKLPKRFIWHPDRVDSRRMELGDPRAHADGKVPDNVWPIAKKVGNALDRAPFKDKPPQLPDELPLRCILAASEPGDLVLDPFNGNGTTGRAALSCGRQYIGIERSKLYAAQAEQWIKAAVNKEIK